jgi:pimeloyl-ACP methyl ester carboxylesterase
VLTSSTFNTHLKLEHTLPSPSLVFALHYPSPFVSLWHVSCVFAGVSAFEARLFKCDKEANVISERHGVANTVVERSSDHRPLRTVLVFALGGVLLIAGYRAIAETVSPSTADADSAPMLVIGFVGGFVHSDDLRHSEPQLAQRLQREYGDHVTVEMFENRERAQAHRFAVEWFDRLASKNAEGGLQPKIILFGHSWGASAAVYLARQLERDDIPVALTVQVDSIGKHGEDDSVIPANAAEAVNFYQPNGILHVRSRITAADPSSTAILGNYRFIYHRKPAACHVYPWYNRHLFMGHTAIECDARVWSQVEWIIEARMSRSPVPTQAGIAAQVTSNLRGSAQTEP